MTGWDLAQFEGTVGEGENDSARVMTWARGGEEDQVRSRAGEIKRLKSEGGSCRFGLQLFRLSRASLIVRESAHFAPPLANSVVHPFGELAECICDSPEPAIFALQSLPRLPATLQLLTVAAIHHALLPSFRSKAPSTSRARARLVNGSNCQQF